MVKCWQFAVCDYQLAVAAFADPGTILKVLRLRVSYQPLTANRQPLTANRQLLTANR